MKLKVLISEPDGNLVESFWIIAQSDAQIRGTLEHHYNVFDSEEELDKLLAEEAEHAHLVIGQCKYCLGINRHEPNCTKP